MSSETVVQTDGDIEISMKDTANLNDQIESRTIPLVIFTLFIIICGSYNLSFGFLPVSNIISFFGLYGIISRRPKFLKVFSVQITTSFIIANILYATGQEAFYLAILETRDWKSILSLIIMGLIQVVYIGIVIFHTRAIWKLQHQSQ